MLSNRPGGPVGLNWGLNRLCHLGTQSIMHVWTTPPTCQATCQLQCRQQQAGADLVDSKSHGSICSAEASCLLDVLLVKTLGRCSVHAAQFVEKALAGWRPVGEAVQS